MFDILDRSKTSL